MTPAGRTDEVRRALTTAGGQLKPGQVAAPGEPRWYRAQDVRDLTVEEFGVLATRRGKALANAIKLDSRTTARIVRGAQQAVVSALDAPSTKRRLRDDSQPSVCMR